MTEDKEKFLGTYFDRDAVLRLAGLAKVLSWVFLVVYESAALISLLQFLPGGVFGGVLSEKGASVVNVFGLFMPYVMQILPGIAYFVGFQVVAQALLIFLDVEDNTRRAARK